MIYHSKQRDAKTLPTCLQSEVTQPLPSRTMTDRATRLLTELKKAFGINPLWDAASIQTRLERNESKWDITRMYYQNMHDYSYYRPLARLLHSRCKREIGKLPTITEEMIRRWILVDYWSDVRVLAEYQKQFDEEYPNVRRAKWILAELRRDLGHCDTVGEPKILFWVENDVAEEKMRENYKAGIEHSKVLGRAKVLQYRLGDDLSRELNVPIPDLLNHFREDLTDDEIVKHYQEQASKP